MDSVKTDFNDNGKVVNVTLHKNYLKDDDSWRKHDGRLEVHELV